MGHNQTYQQHHFKSATICFPTLQRFECSVAKNGNGSTDDKLARA